MEIEELIELMKKKSVTPEAVESFRIRHEERCKRLEEEAKRRKVTKKVLDRQYTI